MPRGQGYETPLQRIRVDEPLWKDFGAASTSVGSDRSKVIRQFMEWFAGHPGAELPERPVGAEKGRPGPTE